MSRPHYDSRRRRVVWEMDADEAEWVAVELSPDGLARDLFAAVDEMRAAMHGDAHSPGVAIGWSDDGPIFIVERAE